MLLASSGQNPRTLLDILQRIGQPPRQGIIQPEMLTVPALHVQYSTVQISQVLNSHMHMGHCGSITQNI